MFKKFKPNRKVKRRPLPYRMQRSLIDWIKMSIMLGCVLGMIIFAYHFLMFSSFFRLKEIEVRGNFSHYNKQQIVVLAHAPMGKNLFLVNLYEIAQNLKRAPWIKDVEVRRIFPQGLAMSVQEYEPSAILMMQANSLMTRPEIQGVDYQNNDWLKKLSEIDFYYINRDGLLFKKLGTNDDYRFPIITGFKKEDLARFPSYFRPRLKETIDFCRAFSAKNSFWRVYALHSDLTEGIDLSLIPAESPVCQARECNPIMVYFGKGNYEAKIQRWLQLASEMQKEQIKYHFVDLHVNEKIFARK